MRQFSNAALESTEGQPMTLLGVNVRAQITDLLSQSTIVQTYRNDENVNIEAVYTFQLPLDATLLDLEIKLGNKVLKGLVIARAEAKKRYEKSLEDGNSAVHLEYVQPGIYTMNLGNLMSGDTAEIKLEFAQIHSWQQQQMRFYLPTTMAPRYGDPMQSGFEPHQVPIYSMSEDRRFTFEITVDGLLSSATLTSPTHRISVQNTAGKTTITLADENAIMDRDFVLLLDSSTQAPASALTAKDIDGYLVWASFNPQFDIARDETPRSLKIVVDCSGSMNGDSILQAAKAVNRILQSLRPQDYFNVTRFGNSHRSLFALQTPATLKNISHAASIRWNADMGGTEMGEALDHVYQLPSPVEYRHDVLLITDGEVHATEALIQNAIKSGHRLFTVGVGSAVAEALLRQLAEKTGGACEFVTPNENMAERIHRHFSRIYESSAEIVSVDWPGINLRQYPPMISSLFSGDTIHLFGWFDTQPTGNVSMHIQKPDGTSHHYTSSIQTLTGSEEKVPSNLARLAAAIQLKGESNREQVAEIALRYQIISRETNYFLSIIREEDEQAADMPELRLIPQRMAAGWHGSGSVVGSFTGKMPNTRQGMNSLTGFNNVAYCRTRVSSPKTPQRSCFSAWDSSPNRAQTSQYSLLVTSMGRISCWESNKLNLRKTVYKDLIQTLGLEPTERLIAIIPMWDPLESEIAVLVCLNSGEIHSVKIVDTLAHDGSWTQLIAVDQANSVIAACLALNRADVLIVSKQGFASRIPIGSFQTLPGEETKVGQISLNHSDNPIGMLVLNPASRVLFICRQGCHAFIEEQTLPQSASLTCPVKIFYPVSKTGDLTGVCSTDNDSQVILHFESGGGIVIASSNLREQSGSGHFAKTLPYGQDERIEGVVSMDFRPSLVNILTVCNTEN